MNPSHSKNKAQFEKFKTILDEMEKKNEWNLLKAFKEVNYKSKCCNADLAEKYDKAGHHSIFCSKCKKLIMGCLGK